MKQETINGTTYYIGRNTKENWDLFSQAEPCDLWFHLDEGPSSHVFLPVRDEIKQEEINEAAKLCKKHSIKNEKHKHENKDNKKYKKTKVIYCEVRFLQKGRVVGEIIIDKGKEQSDFC